MVRKRGRTHVGALLVRAGLLSEDQFGDGPAHGFSDFAPEPDEMLDREVAERLGAVPLRCDEDGILVAMVHPDGRVAFDGVSVRAGGEAVYPAAVSPMALEFS